MNNSQYPRASTLHPSIFAAAMLAIATAGAGCLEPSAETADETAESSQASDLDLEPLPGPPILLQTCLTQTADATMTVGKQPDGTYFSHVVSTGTAYTTGVCPYFVVDVIVPGAYTVGGPLVFSSRTAASPARRGSRRRAASSRPTRTA
jgi:hypothetical protein